MYYINRLEKEIKYKISLILIKFINDNRLKNITILDVKLYKDFSLVKIYVYSLNNIFFEKNIKLLNNASNFIRNKLIKSIKTKKFPKLLFLIDNSIKNANNIIKLINNNLNK